MNKKISKILGVGLTVALLASLLVIAVPASAATLSWSEEAAATDLKAKVDNVLSVTDLDIVDLAVKGDVIYAATSNSSSPLYKSTNGGKSWANLYSSTSFPTGAALKAVAIAPDNADIVAIITATDNVAYSTNGGSSWTVLGRPADGALAVDIDVAPGGSYIAVGGNTSADAPELWTFYLALAQTWTARATAGTAANFTSGQKRIEAVKFSPNFSTDKIITVVSSNATSASFQLFRYETGAFTWNGGIAFLTLLDWLQGITICAVTGGVAKADIALPATYIGTNRDSRLAFVAVAGTTTGGGVSRISDNYLKAFQTWSAGDEGAIGSVAYHDSGKLLAGSFGNVESKVYVALTPVATTPSFERVNTLKQPGGENRTIVAWSGDNAIAGTSGDESAFAKSTDSGYAFNDISLIDSANLTIVDIAVSADGSKYYLTSYDGNDVSVWLRDTAWTRVLSLKNQTNVSLFARVAPDNAAAVYVAAMNSQDMWVSKDSGMKDWKSIPVYSLGTADVILDFVPQTADIVYAIDDDGVTQTSNAGISWGTQKRPVDAFVPYMITLARNSANGSDVLVGGSDGYVAYSKDSGATFTRTQQVTTTGTLTVQVAADKAYATNSMLYAGAGLLVKRGKADATSTWTTLSPTIDTTQSVRGLVADNVTSLVYVLTANTTASALFRSLNLDTAVSATNPADIWSSKTAAYSYVAAPQALKMSAGYKLWAIGTPNLVHSFSDTIAATAPTLTGPATGASVKVNPGTGQAYNVTFTFTRQSDKVTNLQLQIATDSAFNALIYDSGSFAVTTDTIARVIGPTAQIVVDYNPNTTYYWRIRTAVDGPIYSPWTAARSFTVESPIAYMIVAPERGAEGVSIEPTVVWNKYEGAIGYELVVSLKSDFSIVEFSHSTTNLFWKVVPPETLAYNTTYFWKVRGVTGPAVGLTPAPGGDWQIGIFTTEAKPAEPTPPVIIQQPAAPEIKVIEVPVERVVPQAIPSFLLWAIIAIGAVLIIALIVLIVRTRRVA